MTLNQYYSKRGARGIKALAKVVGCHYVYLYQCRVGLRKPSPDLARRLNDATRGGLTLYDLRPDIWKKKGAQ